MRLIEAVSVSSVVNTWLDQGIEDAQVLAVFDRAINLAVVRDCGQGAGVIVLCHSAVGNGPLNAVLNPWPDWPALSPQSSLVIKAKAIQLGGYSVRCDNAVIWNPTPDWVSIRNGLSSRCISAIQQLAYSHRRRSALLSLVCGDLELSTPVSVFFQPGLSKIHAGLSSGDAIGVANGAAAMAGLGEGLTPAGDDFLCGLMLGLWATSASPQPLCKVIKEAAAPLTTTLSAAFLARAANGQVNDSWNYFFKSMLELQDQLQLKTAIAGLVTSGHSSGADMLAGFVWGVNQLSLARRNSFCPRQSA